MIKFFSIAIIFIGLIGVGFLLGFNKGQIADYELVIPKGFPEPVIPENNQLTTARIELGRQLFYDPILSIDSSISCASCHHQSLGFADNKVISPGVDGRLATRNAPTLANVAYNPTFLFDGYLETLEMQILVPIQEHAEFNHNIVEIAKVLKRDTHYVQMSLQAYDRMPDHFVITRSISAFERTLISGNSIYDQEVNQGKKVMSKSQKRGMNLFLNELHCTKCHGGFNFTNFSTQNNGLYEVYADSGRMRATKLEIDRAMFKVPTLRNIALTAPYMHDGSLANLDAVIRHYEKGGVHHKNKNPIIQPFKLSNRERTDLIHFLESLTDESFIENPAFGSLY
ncbi:c-type cytochrome [Crocinitomix sp.]|nr:c-type cytochrome [Crocinitomix sp.]